MSKDIASIINQLSFPDEITLFQVEEKQLNIGSRIEGYTVLTYLFKDEEKAVDYAFELYKKYLNSRVSEDTNLLENIQKSDEGKYTQSYDPYWDDYSITTYPIYLNFKEDIINTRCHSD